MPYLAVFGLLGCPCWALENSRVQHSWLWSPGAAVSGELWRHETHHYDAHHIIRGAQSAQAQRALLTAKLQLTGSLALCLVHQRHQHQRRAHNRHRESRHRERDAELSENTRGGSLRCEWVLDDSRFRLQRVSPRVIPASRVVGSCEGAADCLVGS